MIKPRAASMILAAVAALVLNAVPVSIASAQEAGKPARNMMKAQEKEKMGGTQSMDAMDRMGGTEKMSGAEKMGQTDKMDGNKAMSGREKMGGTETMNGMMQEKQR